MKFIQLQGIVIYKSALNNVKIAVFSHTYTHFKQTRSFLISPYINFYYEKIPSEPFLHLVLRTKFLMPLRSMGFIINIVIHQTLLKKGSITFLQM